MLAIAKKLGPSKKDINKEERLDILLTGTFYADNWLLSHILPIARSRECSRVIIVTDYPVPSLRNVDVVRPFPLLTRFLGSVPSRLITFFWTGLRRKPEVVGGFHLLFNGLMAALLAQCIGARSMYFCVGGPTETLYGGRSENRLFGKLEQPDPLLTVWLIRAVSSFDQIITMGSRAKDFFESRGVKSQFDVVSGAIDAGRFFPSLSERKFDLILVARLSPVKRVDLLIEIVKKLKLEFHNISVAIVGDGPLLNELMILSKDLKVEDNIVFAGHQKNVEEWLRKSKIFVLTSSSEGLALAMMEAMMCGVPAVVPNVGDLDTLVENGVNGFLICDRSVQNFVERIRELLIDEDKLHSFSKAALASTQKYHPSTVAAQWDEILLNLKMVVKKSDKG